MELYKKPDRFKIAPSCPCGKANTDGKFVPFIINGVPSSHFGYCHSCGETFLPERKQIIKQKLFIPPRRAFQTISIQIFEATLNHYDSNTFAIWLSETFKEKALIAIKQYNVGTNNLYQTIFWYVDIYQQIRTGKLFTYQINGKRNKKHAPKLLFTQEFGYSLCLFGEHLLNYNNFDKTIILVESEKTAIVGSIVFPQYIWLATGGANALTKTKAQALKYRKVIIIPDCDDAGRKGAERNLKIVKEVYCNASISNMGYELNNGEDLVDLIILSSTI